MTQASHQQKISQQLRLLNELSMKLQSLIQSESFYQDIVDLVQNHFNYYSVHIWNVNDDGTAYSLGAQAGAYRSHLPIGHTMKVSQGIAGHVIQNKESYLCNDVSKDEFFTSLNLPVSSKSELSVPILRDNQVFGTLNIESDRVDFFDTDDVVTLEALAAQVAVAIVNRALYQESLEFNQRLQTAVDEKTVELKDANERILQQQKMLQKENKTLKTLVKKDNDQMEMIGESPAIRSLLSMVDKIAPTTATVLIQGESGTGKELVARRLHFKSDRDSRPYVAVNCGALQESLLESELFGHEKGAFTGAVSQKIGLCEMADGGTLFLDEIGEMSLSIQAKLLRFLQEGEFYRIGGKRPLRVDVRVISATNRDLEQEVRDSRFREDLFYRLNTITLRMPPLRKRKEDLHLLVKYFLENSRFGGSNQVNRIDPRVYDVFEQYDWPGNIRELQNTIERLKILSENNEIRLDDIPFNIRMPKQKTDKANFAFDMPLEEVEKSHILRTLAYNHGNKTKTARSLGITIKTLYNKLHRYGILGTSNQGEVITPTETFQ